MDFKDSIKALADRAEKLRENLKNEEATKMALIVPFIQALGYDVFDPTEVEPECVADIMKKGEKVDYAIHKDGEQQLLIECKHWEENLDVHGSQLRRYYNVSPAKFGLLTNGINYRFYTDLISSNILDEKPFLEFDITSIKDAQIEELKKFHKSYYDRDNILNTASELKYMGELRAILQREFSNPSIEFVKVMINPIWEGSKTQKIIDQFTPLVKKTLSYYINDIINERIKGALNNEEKKEDNNEEDSFVTPNINKIPTASKPENESDDDRIITTEEEIEAYRIVKAIARQVASINRIDYRDNQSYFNILLDNNARKPICRIYLNTSNHYIGTFDPDKKETRHPIETLDDIYNYSDTLIETIKNYDKEKEE